LDVLGHDEEGLAYIFVWLRFSAIRQLTWQRHFNTQPRALSHALDRLTLKLSHIYMTSNPQHRELIRLILTTLGRGGEGQCIRDEFLNIMHRHKIKEVPGHFLEEWHQKIHNNTTPDDIIICQAYLAFLRHNGNLDLFFKILEEGDVSKERLEGFERPIVTEPEFYSGIKNELIQDFGQYLKILKSVHSGTDLETAIESTRHLVDQKTNLLLNFISEHRDDPKIGIVSLIKKIAEVRTFVKNLACHHWDDEKIRDLLLLDLALEESMRILVERHIHHLTDGDQLVDLIASVLDNEHLNRDDDEISACYRHWARLKEIPRLGRNWSLQAKAVLDRLGRAIGAYIDRYHRLIQPKAEFFGKAFHADLWSITLFGEEIVRGRPIFILSMLLRHLDPILRQKANLGNWQVICPSQAAGRVKVVDTLRSIQGKTFSMPAIIIADKIGGDEEIPGGVMAIITPDLVDIVSHIAIRARNKRLLFATCYDLEMINTLKSLNGRSIHLAVDSKGEVEIKKEKAHRKKTKKIGFQIQKVPEIHPDLTLKAISSKDFNEETVGRKSLNLMLLQSKLPDWIHLPASIALPFGVFEKVLSEGLNKNIARHHKRLIQRIEENPPEILAELRKALMDLEPPDVLRFFLEGALTKAEMPYPEKWDRIWTCIKQVWASKWNERAYLSRETKGIPHDNLFIAVLIQQVVEAEYAFVIHTVNPFTGNQNELYAEIVSGLGETLVGNYPGRALSFISNKDRFEPSLFSYPSKSFGLYGHQSLIFRSDSNGEDLSDYAGAGLYDSVMLESPREILLDYAKEPLLWDEDFRSDLLLHIIQIGLQVEEVFGGHPQDIEGAYSKGNYYVLQSRPQVGL
jgi:alpha-glucan,water dikinase